MKKLIFGSIILTLSLFVFANIAGAKVDRVPGGFGQWEFTAPKTITFTCGGSWYHTLLTVSNLANGNFEGTGVWNGSASYTWDINGNINGDDITFHLVYNGGNPGYTLNGIGTIASDGSISGRTDGNCTAFAMGAGSATHELITYKNHGQYVKSQENKQEAAQSRIGMPVQSKGHEK